MKRSTKTGGTVIDNSASALEQIAAAEEAQEQRVQEAIRSYAATKEEAEKNTAITLQKEEERMREEAQKELRAYAETTLSQTIRDGEDETKHLLVALDEQYRKNAPAVVDTLMTTVLTLIR